ncbi:MAG: hypothetical protein M1462_03390, partial [Candidatus Thermoplasmatota archaeon]|nr:hypothetical protein [Candidatus Thermoplasmatota archaeon]
MYNLFAGLYVKKNLDKNDSPKNPERRSSTTEYWALNSVLANIPPNVKINANGKSYEMLLKTDNLNPS